MRAPTPPAEVALTRRSEPIREQSKPLSFVRIGEELHPLSRLKKVIAPGGERTEFYGEGGRLLATTFQRNR